METFFVTRNLFRFSPGREPARRRESSAIVSHVVKGNVESFWDYSTIKETGCSIYRGARDIALGCIERNEELGILQRDLGSFFRVYRSPLKISKATFDVEVLYCRFKEIGAQLTWPFSDSRFAILDPTVNVRKVPIGMVTVSVVTDDNDFCQSNLQTLPRIGYDIIFRFTLICLLFPVRMWSSVQNVSYVDNTFKNIYMRTEHPIREFYIKFYIKIRFILRMIWLEQIF